MRTVEAFSVPDSNGRHESATTASAGQIFGAIIAAKRDIGRVGKDKETTSGPKFTYRSFESVINAVAPLLDRHGIMLVPRVLSRERWSQATRSGGSTDFCLLEMEFTFFAQDGSFVIASSVGQAMDSSDKAATKAQTVALRIALCNLFNLAYEEMQDPESGQQHDWIDNRKTVMRFKKDLAEVKDRKMLQRIVGAAINCKNGLHPSDQLTDREFELLCADIEEAGKRCGADAVRLRMHLDLAMGKAVEPEKPQATADVPQAAKQTDSGLEPEPVRAREIDLMLKSAGNQQDREAAIVTFLESIGAGHVKGQDVSDILNTHFNAPGDSDVAGYFLAWFSNSPPEAILQGLSNLDEARQQKRVGERVGLALRRYAQSLIDQEYA